MNITKSIPLLANKLELEEGARFFPPIFRRITGMRFFQKKAVWWAGSAASVLVVGVVIALLAAQQPTSQVQASPNPNSGPASQDEARSGALSVKTIFPKCDPNFAFSVQEPADVKPYYISELDAQVAGQLKDIRKAEGAPVKTGELLAKIAVPDLDQEVVVKETVIQQRQEELEVARNNKEIAQRGVEVAQNNIEVKKAGEEVAKATEIYRGKFFRRLKRAFSGSVKSALEETVDEAEQNHLAAIADVTRARNDVIMAQSALAEAGAKLGAANADIKLKQALIRVAEQDKEKAKAAASYSEIRSLFSGKIKRRHADPGTFLRIGDPVLIVERTDIVTVTMKVPDTFAPYVNENTDAVIEMSELPGQAIHAKVTRQVPSLETKTNDHTMLVLVDLYNGTQKEYDEFIAREKAKKPPREPFDDLKENSLPIAPKLMGINAGDAPHLLPGMYGQMRLVFNKLPNVFLIPSDAIDRSGGTPNIFLVKDSKVHRAEVEVDVDDQKLARVKIVERTATGEAKRALTGKEEIIYSNLNEVTEGEKVETIPIDWKPRD
jgi:multidrug efflux pump subunit AcrA (membrane-fusion protein)